MKAILSQVFIVVATLLWLVPASASDGRNGNLVSAAWLQKNLAREDLLVLDTSPTKAYVAKHIPGAVAMDVMSTGLFNKQPVAAMEQRLHALGIDPSRTIVIHDEGASWTATWLFAELHYLGFPAANLVILDGGLAKWEASGGAVTKDATPAPKKGAFRIAGVKHDERTQLPEFLVASGDRANQVLVDALETPYYYGGAKFFDRGGHVPNAVSLPVSDFFNADKTFKSADEIRRMAAYQGIAPEHTVHSHCGGGGAAATPFFALRFIAGYPKVKIYKESQREWLEDERGLPFWTYATPSLSRDSNWVQTWGGRMLRMFGIAQLSVVDIRPAEAFNANHVPFAVNVPADVFKAHVNDPAKLAEVLAAAGVNPAHEAVIVSGGSVNKDSALAFAMLEKLGQKKVSVLKDSVDEFGLRGFPLTKEPTTVGPPKSPQGFFVPPTAYPVQLRSGVMVKEARGLDGAYPKVFIASGKKVPDKAQAGKVVHVPYSDLLNPDGTPKAAGDIWNVLAKAGVPKYAEIVCFSDDPGEAAANYFVLKLMGFPDVKVLVTG